MKIKRILSMVTALAMGVTMMSAINVSASTDGPTIVDCATNAEISAALTGLNEGDSIVINVTNDTSDRASLNISGSNITINLKENTLSQVRLEVSKSYDQTLTINNGTIRGVDDILEYGASSVVINKTNLICNNATIYGGNGTDFTAEGGYAIQCNSQEDKVELNNCYVSSGYSVNGKVRSAIYAQTGTIIAITNTTLTRGKGIVVSKYPLIQNATLQDASGNKIEKPDYTISTLKIGINTITQDDKTPARADSPVTAKASIPTPSYTITIPAEIDFGEVTAVLPKHKGEAGTTVSKDFEVVCTSAKNLFDGNYISVSIAQDTNTAIKLYNADKSFSIDCALKKGDTAYTLGTEFARFFATVDLTAGQTNTQTGTITLDRTDITQDVSATGNMTFNVSVKKEAV